MTLDESHNFARIIKSGVKICPSFHHLCVCQYCSSVSVKTSFFVHPCGGLFDISWIFFKSW